VSSASFSTENLDYLQRSSVAPAFPVRGGFGEAPPALRRLVRIDGIGRPPNDRTPARPEGERRSRGEQLLTGLYGYKFPVAIQICGSPRGIELEAGTWAPRHHAVDADVLDVRADLLATVLRATYPGADLRSSESASGDPMTGWRGGIALGVPTTHAPNPEDGSLPLDRLVDAMADAEWRILVLAEPVDESVVASIRNQIINEKRAVEALAQAERAPSPLAKHYAGLLDLSLKILTQGQAAGGWRTTVYLAGGGHDYWRLASAWRSLFSGERSLPEPLRIWDGPGVAELAAAWRVPDGETTPGPGQYQHPFEYQTLLTSSQLGAYFDLPRVEALGFQVRLLPRFDVVRKAAPAEGVEIGNVMSGSAVTGSTYRVRDKDVTKHALVAGVTGAGKTNTIFHLLGQLAQRDVPFLVIEPAKREYRALLGHPELKDSIQVYTPGDELISPLRINPFEVVDGGTAAVHLDLLRSAFAAGFGLWTPLPQVLERCLHRVYVDRGWDLATNTNARLDAEADPALAIPTLSDLVSVVDEVTTSLGYEERITSDLRAALLTRLEALRTGGKGLLLDVERSTPLDHLFDRPAIIELEGLGDDDDKAFVMGLLLVRLVEYRRSRGEQEGLRHVLVVEEAHRLLAATKTEKSEEEANPRGKAVETFANLLSEIRAYGQGVLISDQVPVRLDPQVIKNTNLKIAHRVVASDDRKALAGAMAMDERQERAISVLGVGQAALFSEGDDSPILVQVQNAKLDLPIPANEEVRDHRRVFDTTAGTEGRMGPSTACTEACRDDPAACRAARTIAADPQFAESFDRFVLSAIEDAAAFDRLWPEIAGLVDGRAPARVAKEALMRCMAPHASALYAARRGAQDAWTYSDTAKLQDLLARAVEALADGDGGGAAAGELRTFARQLLARPYPPFPLCERICTQQPPVCIYRRAAQGLVPGPRLRELWFEAEQDDFAAAQTDGAHTREETWSAAMDAAGRLVEFPYPEWDEALRDQVATSARRSALCYAQQVLASDDTKTPRRAARAMEEILAVSGHEGSADERTEG
jgi:hypothetical protein